ncbi:hypothetical protein HO173_004572 [Letharia columbiana]|uniref:DUF7730 domain-containing protein n=1 Tax=Letharia columbiana TaxID=112416 RepID=A0A8H6L6B5_9LECA|nr:uncharacterized protein HO173_004572 [Letharia columbiana]KAF6237104.1 hypothetical protein HO173_004572 [Letharia columbiana]
MAPTRAHESLRPPLIHQFKFDDFNIYRLMAENAMHDGDYRAQLERSAYGHDKPIELSKLNGEIENGMAALGQKHINDEEEAWIQFCRQVFKAGERRGTAVSRQTSAMNGQPSMAGLPETNGRDWGNMLWARDREWMFTGTASSSARRALTMLAANQRTEADSRPFQLMKLPTELREQVYRELLIGEGRRIVVSADSVSSMWSRSCKMEGPYVYGKEITTALLRTNRRIHDEALPVLYQSHAFDFGIDVHYVAPFFDQISTAARRNVGCIHMELIRYGIGRPLRSVPERDVNDNCLDWSDACAYIAGHLRVKEFSFNINFTIPQDFQRFRWVKDLIQVRGVSAVFHHNSANKHGLKSENAWIQLANQMSREDWGADEYRWETLLEYLNSEMLHKVSISSLGCGPKAESYGKVQDC